MQLDFFKTMVFKTIVYALFGSALGFLLLPTVASIAAAQENADASQVVSVAVLDFEAATSEGESKEKLGENVSAILTSLLSTEEKLLLVERAELQKLLSEQSLSFSGTVDAKSAATVGKLTGADVLVSGRIFSAGNQRVLIAKIMGAETSRVFGEMVSTPSEDPYPNQVNTLAEKIKLTLANKQSLLVAEESKPEDVIAKLKEVIKGKKLPSVKVVIKERSYGSDTVDPAAQTEVSTMLQQLGFKLYDPKTSGITPDVTISGEAFSEIGLKKGGLVSARARVEIKAVETKDGKVLAVDRQTDVALDIADRIAEKKALQSAAVKVARRIIPLLQLNEAGSQ